MLSYNLNSLKVYVKMFMKFHFPSVEECCIKLQVTNLKFKLSQSYS